MFLKSHSMVYLTGFLVTALTFPLATLAVEIGEGALVDVNGTAKNWESGKVVAVDGNMCTVKLIGVGEHKGEWKVPVHYLYGYHKNAPQGTGAGGSVGTTDASGVHDVTRSGSTQLSGNNDPVKVGEGVLIDVTGAAKNWESGKVIAKDASGYTVKLIGVGEHKGEWKVPLNYIFGYHKPQKSPGYSTSSGTNTATTASSAASQATNNYSSSATSSVHQSTAKDGFTSKTSDAWKSLSADIDARIAKVDGKPAAGPHSAPAKAIGGEKGLSGLYLRHAQVFMGNSLSYNEDHFLFFPDGRFYHGVPPEGPGHFNWAKELKAHPENCGYYGISGNQITFAYPGNENITWTMKRKGSDQMELNYGPTVKVESFGQNAKLSGTFARGTSFGSTYSPAGAPTITSSGVYTFSSNGTVSNSSMGATGGDTKDVGVTARVSTTSRGTYSINGNDMEINLGGQSMRCTAYPVSKNGVIQRISIDGLLYEKRK
ncbi:hypothetical protein KF707_02005 [Candidatus Obscuribacterales bacterium]|nr:hypothetical protein [Candidatus Obscuribacterales bacterium]MBX3134978.1 hypothetical protein [Candidatus Obscuribacterales bacterium]MBX3151764.1 hypothetical protein [Candidatus Obscuribacterales bacterium]